MLTRRFILVSLFASIYFFGLSQDQPRADSLRLVLEQNQNMPDSVKWIIMSRIAQHETNPEKVKKYSENLLALGIRTENIDCIYNGYYYLAFAEKHLGNISSALQSLFKCLEYSELIGRRAKCETLTAIADVYKGNQDYKNAFLYYRKSINLFQTGELTVREYQSLAIAYGNMADVYLTLKKYDSALFYFETARPMLEMQDYRVHQAYIIGNIGLAYAGQGLHEQAEGNINQAVDVLLENRDYYAVSVYYTYMADIYLEKNNLEKALRYAMESYDMAKEYHLKEQMRDACLKLFEIHNSVDNVATALQYHLEYVAYKDSIVNNESIRQMADLRTAHEVGQKQVEVDLITAQQKTERVILIAIAALALVLIVLALIIFKYYRSKAQINRVLEQQKVQLEALNSTKDKFFSIISHDLRGPVSSFFGISRMIKYLVKSQETDQLLEIADDIDQSVERLSNLLDNLLSWAMQQQGQFPNIPEKVQLKEMADELVGTLNTMAGAKKITLSNSIDDEIELWVDKNTTMTILRNLVNNALKFTPEEGSVSLSAKAVGQFAEIRVEDTGIGIPKEKLTKLFGLEAKKSTYGTSGEKGLGLGLQLVYEFIEMNRGQINVESQQGKGTVFSVRLPLFGKEHLEKRNSILKP